VSESAPKIRRLWDRLRGPSSFAPPDLLECEKWPGLDLYDRILLSLLRRKLECPPYSELDLLKANAGADCESAVLLCLSYRELLDCDVINWCEKHFSNLCSDFEMAKKPEQFSLVEAQSLADQMISNNPILLAHLPSDRSRPGRFYLRDKRGEWLKSAGGELWQLKMLARSGRNYPYYQFGGQTPTGLYQLKGVMPLADRVELFGEYRRLKISFLDSPPEIDQRWPQQAHFASKIGRDLLRIHGSGPLEDNRQSPDFPFVATSGCLTTCEYDSPAGQRALLDALMRAQELEVCFENEVLIDAYLLVLEGN
jgi:hypothetical protein